MPPICAAPTPHKHCGWAANEEESLEQGIRVAVRAIIVRDGLVALAAFDDESGYHYNLPGGGLEPGESLHDGLRREVREELGCEITIGPLLLAHESRPAKGLQVPPYAIHGVGLFFQCALASGSEPHLPEHPDPNQVDVCWVPLTQLKHAPLLPRVGAQIEQALTHCLADPLIIEDVHTFPARLPNWQPLPPLVISTEAERGRPLGVLLNCRQIHPGLFTGGMPTARWLQAAAEAGFEAIINLASESGEAVLQDEAALCARLGLDYVHLPVDWQAPTVADYLAFERALAALGARRTLVHCRRNYRASAFAYLYQVRRGADEAAARGDMLAVWTPNSTWQALIDAVLTL
jgi:8-oxo-dGTP pyrophosphatase MutT (NUDIX family)/protein tyrosine phosphatase (PTP) superfamily phosphohydrolase (DUF442 family)